MQQVEIRHAHFFCGLGGGKGFNRARPVVGNQQAKFRCIGGIDVDPAGIVTSGPVMTRTGDVRDWMRQQVAYQDGTTAIVQAHTWTGHATDLMYCVGKARAGRLLDGITHDGFPS